MKVSLAFDKSQVLPGEDTRLTVGSKAQSIVYLLSIDSGITISQTGYDITMNDVSGQNWNSFSKCFSV